MAIRNRENTFLYNQVLSFCRKNGFLMELNKSLKVSESDRFNNKNIDRYGLDILDVIHCLVDKKRTMLLMNEVSKMSKKNSVIIEAGIGTGILSIVGARRSSFVYGYEINKNVYTLAKYIKNYLISKKLISNNLDFVLGDARNIRLKNKVDIIISENLYTGMFFEKQIDIVTTIRRNLKEEGVFIPSGIKSSFALLEVISKKNNGGKLYIVSENKINFVKLSDEFMYDDIRFKDIKRKWVIFKSKIFIKKSGVINSLLISSEVLLPSGLIIGRHDTKFMNNDIVVLIDRPLIVKRGDIVFVSIKYKYGSLPESAKLTVSFA